MSIQPFFGPSDPANPTGKGASANGAIGRSGAGDDDAEVSHQVRTQFLRRVAHDIASPTGVTLTVLEELAGADKPRPELVAMARRSLRRLMRLSEHLALVAELETEEIQPEPSAVDMRALTKQALDDALAVDGRKDVVAACDVPSHPLLLTGDPRLLVVVLRELVGNALRLASSRVEVSVKKTGETIVFRVDDDGPGFAEDAMATFGQRFVRRAARGLGLSLSMAREIVEAHGGAIEVQTSILPPGRRGAAGAAVVVTLPIKAPLPAADI